MKCRYKYKLYILFIYVYKYKLNRIGPRMDVVMKNKLFVLCFLLVGQLLTSFRDS